MSWRSRCRRAALRLARRNGFLPITEAAVTTTRRAWRLLRRPTYYAHSNNIPRTRRVNGHSAPVFAPWFLRAMHLYDRWRRAHATPDTDFLVCRPRLCRRRHFRR
jgi:hypothetical protein